MTVRPIDGDALKNQIRHIPRTINPDLVQYSLVQAIIADMPTLTPPNDPTYPCDLCVYNPPSSLDGKPCTFCPATGRPPEGES